MRRSYVALITPFTIDGAVDFNTYRKLIHFQIENGTDGIVILGTTGEKPTLTKNEQVKLIDVAIETANKKIPIIVNTGTNCTRESVLMTQTAKEKGADFAMAVVPYYNKPEARGILAHFSAIAKVGLPLICYHHPGRTGTLLSSETLLEISKTPNIIGIKEASGDLELIKHLAENQVNLFSGHDDLFLQQRKLGVESSISVIANAYPTFWKQIVSNDSCELFNELKSLIDALGIESNPQGIKCAMNELGLCENILRLPLTCVEKETEDKIKKVVRISAVEQFVTENFNFRTKVD